MNPQCNMRNAVLSIIVFVCGFLAGFLLRPVVLPSRDGGSSVITRTDTLTVRDTVIERMTEYIDRTVLDTVLVAVSDTVMSRDTVYIRAAAVQEHYKGEDYDAWVSGWELSGRGPSHEKDGVSASRQVTASASPPDRSGHSRTSAWASPTTSSDGEHHDIKLHKL